MKWFKIRKERKELQEESKELRAIKTFYREHIFPTHCMSISTTLCDKYDVEYASLTANILGMLEDYAEKIKEEE
jgi:hypothetical protein